VRDAGALHASMVRPVQSVDEMARSRRVGGMRGEGLGEAFEKLGGRARGR